MSTSPIGGDPAPPEVGRGDPTARLSRAAQSAAGAHLKLAARLAVTGIVQPSCQGITLPFVRSARGRSHPAQHPSTVWLTGEVEGDNTRPPPIS
jgi:hypothetical protein